MDPKELIELVKGGAAVAGAFKLTDIIRAMLGPATAEIAEQFRDKARLYRYERQLDCLKKAAQMAKDAGFTPMAVPIKLLFPLLEGALLEESEDLHTMWAALLANASSPEDAEKVRPGFIAILRQLSPEEAALLNCIYKRTKVYGDIVSVAQLKQQNVFKTLDVSLDGLEASQLVCSLRPHVAGLSGIGGDDLSLADERRFFGLTSRGGAFVEACRTPEPKR
ncbi:MAG: Abi-alpha family protein [Bryobacteraceae bacterium]|jgi:hypothetical protein